MPNWVNNKLKIIGKNPENIIKDLLIEKDDETIFDFNKVVPMPESIEHQISGTIEDNCMKLFMHSIKKTDELRKYISIIVLSENNYIPIKDEEYPTLMTDCLKYSDFLSDKKMFKNEQEVLDYGREAYDNIAKYGAANWYEWAIENWGTKWNSRYCWAENDTIFFSTAWDPPAKVIFELSKKYPDYIFELDFADEGLSVYCGEFSVSNGNINRNIVFNENSKEAFEKGFELWPNTQQHYKFNKKTNTYEYKEDYMD